MAFSVGRVCIARASLPNDFGGCHGGDGRVSIEGQTKPCAAFYNNIIDT